MKNLFVKACCLMAVLLVFSCNKDLKDDVDQLMGDYDQLLEEEKNAAEDLNGQYLVQEVKLGDVSLANFTYDANYMLTEIAIRSAENSGMMIKSTNSGGMDIAKVVKTYTGGLNTGYDVYRYATYSGYNSNVSYINYGNYTPFDHVLTAAEKVVLNDDGKSYAYYSTYYTSGSTYYYYTYPKCAWIPVADLDEGRTIYFPIGSDKFLQIYSNPSRFITDDIDGVPCALVRGNYEYTILDAYEKGDIRDTLHVDIEYNAANLAEKIYMDDERYILNTYDANNLVVKNEIYLYDDVDEVWVKDEDYYVTHTYNSNNQLVSSTSHEVDGDDLIETEIYRVEYDDHNNPLSISLYQEEEVEWMFVEGAGGSYSYEPAVVQEEGFVEMIKVEYNYDMKNFWGHTWNSLIPELQGIQFYNAPTKIYYADHFSYAKMEYSDFNEGGYPQAVKAIARLYDYQMEIGLVDANVELVVNYVEKAE